MRILLAITKSSYPANLLSLIKLFIRTCFEKQHAVSMYFLGDGVYALRLFKDLIDEGESGLIEVFVRKEDAEARGVTKFIQTNRVRFPKDFMKRLVMSVMERADKVVFL
ncbi:MAG: hypothetical protein ACTSXJ_09260 [Candidatus Baldrarchaeia archaeon]